MTGIVAVQIGIPIGNSPKKSQKTVDNTNILWYNIDTMKKEVKQ